MVVDVAPAEPQSCGLCTAQRCLREGGDRYGLNSSWPSAHQEECLVLCGGRPKKGPCCFASFIGQIYVYNDSRVSAETKLMFYCHLIVYVKMGALEHLQIFYGK